MTLRSGLCKPSIICHLMYSPLSLKTLYNCPLTSNGQYSSQSFLRCCSQVIILNLAQIKFPISFSHLLIFCRHAWCSWQDIKDIHQKAPGIYPEPAPAWPVGTSMGPLSPTSFSVLLRYSGKFSWYPDLTVWVMILKMLFKLFCLRCGVLRGTGAFPRPGPLGGLGKRPRET